MKKIILIILTAQLLLFSCKPALKIIKGVKDPQLETYVSSRKYLFKKGMDTTRVAYFKDLLSFAYASKKKYLQIPNAFFFDKNGYFVDYRKSATDCNAKVSGFIEDLGTFNEAKKDSTKTMTDLKSFLVSSNQNLLSEKPAEITIFITWAKWTGALNKEKAFDWVKLVEQAKRKGINVNYYLLNCDYQEKWDLTTEQKDDLGL